MIPDAYPPLRQFLEDLREELQVLDAWMKILEERLEVFEELQKKLLGEKEGHVDN